MLPDLKIKDSKKKNPRDMLICSHGHNFLYQDMGRLVSPLGTDEMQEALNTAHLEHLFPWKREKREISIPIRSRHFLRVDPQRDL